MINMNCDYTMAQFRIKTKHSKNYSMNTRHFHDSYELYYMNSGTRLYFINDTTYKIQPGTLVLISPQVLHKTMDTGEEHSRLLINFKPRFIPFDDIYDLLEDSFPTHGIIPFSINFQNKIEGLLREMIHEANSQSPGYLSRLRSHLMDLLVLASRYHLQNDNPDFIAASDQKIKDIISYLHSHFYEKITLDLLSEEFYVSRYYLSRLFKKETGFTLIEYLHSIRIIEAQKMLGDSNMKIIDIAERTGFNNISNFGKVFKSITHMTPMNYRKMQRLQ